MTEVLSDNQIKKFKEVYKFFDKDNKNEISSLVYCDVVRTLGYIPKDSELEEIKSKHKDKLKMDDFIVIMGRKINNNNSEEEIKEAISIFEDGNGNLNEKEFIHCMKSFGKLLKQNDIDEFLEEFIRKENKISINDFKEKLIIQ
ncbi:EF-hand, partial [Piromyces finnis]